MSGCELVPFCDVPGYEDKCVAEDASSTGDETSTGDGDGDPGDGDGDPGDGDGDPGDGDGDGDSGDGDAPVPPQGLTLSYSQIKQFDFTWTAALGAQHYRLLERANPDANYVQVGADTLATTQSLTVPLHQRLNASYIVQACNDDGCTDSTSVDVVGSLSEAVGYVKASNAGVDDGFGYSIALSDDASTLAVGAYGEASSATNINGNQADNSLATAGAVYVYARDQMGIWTQQAYVKASNTDTADQFGDSVTLSDDGNTLAVGAPYEDSCALGIGGNHADNSCSAAGAVYIYVRDQMSIWTQEAYVKASNTGTGDQFGYSVALSDDGSTLAVGADREASGATGIGGDQTNNSHSGAGAVYMFARDQMGIWTQEAYVKASNTGANDDFGQSVALSDNGSTLAVGAFLEDSVATGIGGDQADNSRDNAGAVYVYARDQMGIWTEEAYIKASNTDAGDNFGYSVALSEDGSTLAVGASQERSSTTGIGGDQADDSLANAGAVYVYTRDPMNIWTQEAYVKASNTGTNDHFGTCVLLSDDGSTLAVGAPLEESSASGIGGDQSDNSMLDAGAVYVYARNRMGIWAHEAYVKASNSDAVDSFGHSVALSGDGGTLAVGAYQEDSNATNIGGDQANDSASRAGSAYLY